MAPKWDTHPAWIQRSKIPVTIVCGPPCSGKTTYVRKMAKKRDVVIDLDAIRRKLNPGFRPWSVHYDEKLLVRAMRVRNMMLGALSVATKGKAWFIVGAPTAQERSWWQAKLGGKVVLLNPGFAECKRRAHARGTPLAAAGVDTWATKSEHSWTPPVQHSGIGPDGWPLLYRDDVDEADVVLCRELDRRLGPER